MRRDAMRRHETPRDVMRRGAMRRHETWRHETPRDAMICGTMRHDAMTFIEGLFYTNNCDVKVYIFYQNEHNRLFQNTYNSILLIPVAHLFVCVSVFVFANSSQTPWPISIIYGETLNPFIGEYPEWCFMTLSQRSRSPEVIEVMPLFVLL